MRVAFDVAVVEELARFSVFLSYPLGWLPVFFWLWFLAHPTMSEINETPRWITFLAISIDWTILNKRGDAGNSLADHELVNVVCAFVGIHALEVVYVPHDAVIVHDAVGAENVARLARGIQRNRHVVHFQHRDVRRIHLAVILQSAHVQRE